MIAEASKQIEMRPLTKEEILRASSDTYEDDLAVSHIDEDSRCKCIMF